MKYAIAFAVLTAFAQYVIVPSFGTGSVAEAAKTRAAMLEEASK